MILTKLDYSILAFIGSYNEIHEDEIFDKFPGEDYATRYRLQLLSKAEYNHLNHTHIPNTNLIAYKYNQPTNSSLRSTQANKTDICYITDFGKKALQDYNFENAENERYRRETVDTARRSNHIAIATFFRD